MASWRLSTSRPALAGFPEEVGGALGVSASVESLTRVIGPVAGALLLDYLGPWAPGGVGAVTMAWLAAYVWRRLVTHPDPHLPGREAEPAGHEPAQAGP